MRLTVGDEELDRRSIRALGCPQIHVLVLASLKEQDRSATLQYRLQQETAIDGEVHEQHPSETHCGAVLTFISATSLMMPRSDFVSSLASFLLCGRSCIKSSMRWRNLQGERRY